MRLAGGGRGGDVSVFGEGYAAEYDARWPDWSGGDITPFLIDRVRRKNRTANTWLDLCCGTGHVLARVMAAGFAATGVDASRHQLVHAKRNAPGAKLHCAKMCDVPLKGRFDVITCLGGSINYLTKRGELQRALRRMKRHLAPGGCVVIDTNTAVGLEATAGLDHAQCSADRVLIVTMNYDAARRLGHWYLTGFMKKGRLYRRYEEHHVQRAWEAADLEPRMTQMGWRVSRCDSDTLGRSRKDSNRLLVFGYAAAG